MEAPVSKDEYKELASSLCSTVRILYSEAIFLILKACSSSPFAETNNLLSFDSSPIATARCVGFVITMNDFEIAWSRFLL